MFNKQIIRLKPYAVAVLNVAIALLLTEMLNTQINMKFSPFLFFFGAAIASAWYGGFGTGVLATILSAVISAYIFIPPIYSLAVGWLEFFRLIIFTLEGMLISAIISALHSAKQRAEVNLLNLKASEQRYRRIIETAYEGIWAFDAQLKINYVNQRIAEMFGCSIEEMLDRSLFEFMDEEARSEATQHVQKQKQGIKEQFDFRYRRKDGSDLWAIVSVNPIFNEQSEFAGAIAMLTDVSERKQAEERLKESDKWLRSIVESQMIGIGFWDLSGTIKDANDALIRMLGYPKEEFISQKILWRDITPPEYHEIDKKAIEQIQSTGFCTPFEKEYICCDGRRIPVLIGGASLEGRNDKGPFFVVDISERKRAEKSAKQLASELQEKANILNAILSASVDHIYIVDRTGRYKYVSAGGAQVMGFAPSDMIDKHWRDLGLPAEIMEPFDADRIQVLSTGKSITIETDFITFSGDIRHYEYIVSPLANGDVNIEAVVAISRDTTDRKHAEEALRQSERRFRRLVESNIFGVVFSDFQGQIYYANDYFLKMVGYDRQDLEAGIMRWDKMTPPEFLYLDVRGAEELKNHGVFSPFEKQYIRKDGSRVPILIGGALLEEPRAGQEEIIGFCLDLTERKKAQEGLKETNQTLQALIQACPLAISVFNLDDGKVKLWNPAAEKIFGWSEAQALGNFLPSISAEKKDEFESHIDFIRQGKTMNGVETQRHKKDGSVIDVSIWATPVRDAKGNVRCMSIVADISDRKRLEAERAELLSREQAARAEAEAANRIKDEFLATLSHELRTPLHAMLGWSHLLHTRKLDEATTARALETIYRNTKSLMQLIDDVLDVSRIITGKLRIELSPVELIPIIQAAIEIITPAADAKKIQIETRLDYSLGPVLGDLTRLQQIIWNLLSNAVKFTPSGGKVEIQLSMAIGDDNSLSPIPQAEIRIIDTGIGINADFLPYVFDRFRQADGTMTRAHDGLGLGLAIVRHLIEMHGGTVRAESPGIGKGATFIVYLPLLEPAAIQNNR